MYLCLLYVTLELETEVISNNRERLLPTIRDKLRQIFGQKLTVRTNDDASLAIAFFDNNFETIKNKSNTIIEKIDACGEARIQHSSEQILRWYDGCFCQLQQDDLSWVNQKTNENDNIKQPYCVKKSIKDSTVVYKTEDDNDFSSIPSRFSKRKF